MPSQNSKSGDIKKEHNKTNTEQPTRTMFDCFDELVVMCG
jgi:hypothetical protein